MPHLVELRVHAGTKSPEDIVVNVQDKTYDYLLTSVTPEIRVSAYFDRDWPQVQAKYAELFVSESCAYQSNITQLIPGSKTRKNITLPGPMEEEEQLVIIVKRVPVQR
jgi:hypothetical protein